MLPSGRHQRAASVTPIIEHSPIKDLQRPLPWRKSHSVEKYEYRDINLNSSIPDKINKNIPLPDDYWKVHEQDVKVWRIGCVSPSRPVSLRDLPKDGNDWEFNVQAYENMGDSRAPARIQYYTGDSDTESKRKHSFDATDHKELKFPGLKAFKSASMRLPGQKSSIQEVHQMLRNKLNRLNVGLRKKRTLSVQEVFQQSPSSQTTPVRSKPQFYVPSPIASSKIYVEDRDSKEPSSLPPIINNSKSNNDIASISPTKSVSPTKSNDMNKQITRTQSYRTKIHVPGVSEPNNTNNGKSSNGSDHSTKSNARLPQFLIGGRVSLRDKSTPKQPSTASKISNAVRERIRRRPRSHSPTKPKTSMANTPKNRDSIGFFDRINRMMHVNHLPPPHGSNTVASNNLNRGKVNGGTNDSHETNGVAAITKKIPNASNGSHDETANNNNNVKNIKMTNNSDLDAPQKPETNFTRDRRMPLKQVRKISR